MFAICKAVPAKKSWWKKCLFIAAVVMAVLLVLLYIFPFLLPPVDTVDDRYELAYPDSIFTEINGVELHYRCLENPRENTTGNVLLIHGFGGSTFSWRYTAPALEKNGYRVVAVDLPGFGLSERSSGLDHTREGRAALIWALIDDLGYPGGWHLVGHSMGGGVVMEMALKNPGRVESIALVAGYINLEQEPRPNVLFRLPLVRKWLGALYRRVILRESIINRMVNSAYGRPVGYEEFMGYYLPLTLENSELVLTDLIMVDEPAAEGFDKLDRPVLCLWGEDDTWVPVERGEHLVEILQRGELVVIPGEGHCPMETAPQLFNHYLMEFIYERY